MRMRFIINAALIGAVSAVVLTGCNAAANKNYKNGMECFNEADYDKAAGYFKQAVEADSNNTAYLVSLGMTQLELLKYDDAQASFDSAIELDQDCADAYRGKGVVYYRNGEYTDAMEAFDKAVSLSDKSGQVRTDSLKYYASCQYIQGDYQGAVDTYDKLIESASKSDKAELYFLRGCAYIKLQDENDAVLDYEKSLDYESDNYETYCNMYTNLKDGGYTERAESYLRRLLDKDKKDNLLFGKTYYNLGDYDKAVEYLESEYKDGNNEAAYYLAMTYEAMENYADADKLYQEYLGKHPNDAFIYNQYGAYLINRGKYANALVYIETGIELGDSDAMQGLMYNQAVCYEYKHDYDKARDAFEEYLKSYPNDEAARKEYDFLMTR